MPVVCQVMGPNTEEITTKTSATQRRIRGNVKFACHSGVCRLPIFRKKFWPAVAVFIP